MKNYPKRLHLCRAMREMADEQGREIELDGMLSGGKGCAQWNKGICHQDGKPCNDIVYERVKRG